MSKGGSSSTATHPTLSSNTKFDKFHLTSWKLSLSNTCKKGGKYSSFLRLYINMILVPYSLLYFYAHRFDYSFAMLHSPRRHFIDDRLKRITVRC